MPQRIRPRIQVRIQAAREPNRIALNVSARLRIVVPVVVVEESGFGFRSEVLRASDASETHTATMEENVQVRRGVLLLLEGRVGGGLPQRSTGGVEVPTKLPY